MAWLLFGIAIAGAAALIPRGGLTQAMLYAGGHLSIALAIFLGLRMHRPRYRSGWIVLAAGFAIYSVADSMWPFIRTFPSIADPIWLVAYALLAVALAMMLRRRTRDVTRGILFDVAIIYIAAGVVSYVFLIEPNLFASGSGLELAASIGYPLMDFLLVAGLLLLAVSAGTRGPAFWLLLSGFATQLATDIVYSHRVLAGTYSFGELFEGYIVASALLGAAALHPTMGQLGESPGKVGQASNTFRISVLGAIALVPSLTNVVAYVIGIQISVGIVSGGSMLLMMLLVGRILGLSREARIRQSEQEALNRELRVREAELYQARDAAEAANRAKSQFLSRMSHELRTPLNSVIGFAQLLESDPLDDDQRDSVRHIIRSGRHLLGLINEVLDLARIEAGRLSVSIEPVELLPVVQESLDSMQPLAGGREIAIQLHVDGDAPAHVSVDRQRLKQVLLNLLSNAVKYNRHGGAVDVRVRSGTSSRARIEISDTGTGMTAEQLELLFTPFERAGADDSAVEGTGLGLAVSKSLTEAMGGSISAASKPGEGSVFSVEFPAAEPPSFDEGLSEGPVAERSEQQATILYIEDNPASMALVESILARRTGFRLIGASRGEEGLRLAREARPNVILLDLNLPDVQGDEVLRRLRQDPLTSQIPVIMLTADAIRKTSDVVGLNGAFAYLTKPLELDNFLGTIDEALTRAEG